MKKVLYCISLIFLVLLTSSNIKLTTAPEETTMVATSVVDEPIPTFEKQLEWKVSVGDVKTFTYTKLYDLFDDDRDGNPNTPKAEKFLGSYVV